jgi:flagellar FliL protein
MASASAIAGEPDAAAKSAEPPKQVSKRLVVLAAPLLLAALFAGLWFTGVLPGMLGLKEKPTPTEDTAVTTGPPVQPVYLDMPDIVANLNTNNRRPSYIKLNARIEFGSQQDLDHARQVLPRLQDMFQTYLREMHPEELRGSAGSYRLHEELIARANIAVAPSRVTNVLFVQMLIQ